MCQGSMMAAAPQFGVGVDQLGTVTLQADVRLKRVRRRLAAADRTDSLVRLPVGEDRLVALGRHHRWLNRGSRNPEQMVEAAPAKRGSREYSGSNQLAGEGHQNGHFMKERLSQNGSSKAAMMSGRLLQRAAMVCGRLARWP